MVLLNIHLSYDFLILHTVHQHFEREQNKHKLENLALTALDLKESVDNNLFVHNRKVKLGPSVPGKEWLRASGNAFFVRSPEIYFFIIPMIALISKTIFITRKSGLL